MPGRDIWRTELHHSRFARFLIRLLAHLVRYDWFEYGLGPGAIWDLQDVEQSELRE